jgi:hypothetical protein
MSKAKRTERETKDHITMLEYIAEEAERKLRAMREAKAKADIEARRDADYLAKRAHEHVKRAKAARAFIAELDVHAGAGIVIQQTANIVDILIESASDLSFLTWMRSDAKAEIAATEASPDVDIKNIPF